MALKGTRQSQPQPRLGELTGALSEADLRVVEVQQADATRRAAAALRLLKARERLLGKAKTQRSWKWVGAAVRGAAPINTRVLSLREEVAEEGVHI